ncbi:helix-turn-helix transcriptional regulator [Curtobacterium sp. MCSS17_007]|uniref:helix-turn-helix transcriptional regulator n=1 Tax=Curtobacterium sp. MCSS17_007 TaxID=2175646 RepID=UPI000DAA595E|nr:helix-turn-helix transcriptional regulator [Curtobacterium sp. MCSS17_007]WIE75653.1 helix-turn-helix transcriptional regulator [Curtobacterium sp. MCSS17_007]
MESDPGQNRLGEYLQARRGLVTPEHVGLPTGPNRRVTGLRREEVALLAGISGDYYLRLERGRDTNPSPQVLEALARVLQLDEVETEFLLALGSRRTRSRRRRPAERIPGRLHHLLAALELPAFVEGRYFDVLAANDLAQVFSPRLRPGQNRLRSLFLDAEERAFQDDWENATTDAVASFRHVVGDDVTDARAVEIVGELSLASARFRTLWARQDVRQLTGNSTVVQHPVVGAMRMHRDKLPVEGLLLVVYYPDTASDSAEKLQLLAGLVGSVEPALRSETAEPQPHASTRGSSPRPTSHHGGS